MRFVAMQHATAVRRLALIALLSLGAAATVLPAPAVASRCVAGGSDGSAIAPTADTLRETTMSVLHEINSERVARELVPLSPDPRLRQAAHGHTRDMVRRAFFSHVTPEGRGMTARVRTTGYLRTATAWALGEMLAWGDGWCSTPAAVVAAWMRSQSHRRVMLGRRYREIGVGVELGIPFAASPLSGATYTADLGSVRP